MSVPVLVFASELLLAELTGVSPEGVLELGVSLEGLLELGVSLNSGDAAPPQP